MAQFDPRQNLRDGISDYEVWTVHQGDSKSLLNILDTFIPKNTLKEGFVQTVLTSPPYADMIDYSSGPEEIGRNGSYREYLDDLRQVFKHAYDITASDGTLWVVVDEFKENHRVVQLPTDIAAICENLENREECPTCGASLLRQTRSGRLECESDLSHEVPNNLDESWRLRDVIIWEKAKARPFSGPGKFRNAFEYVLSFSKEPRPKLFPDRIRVANPQRFSHWWVNWPERYHPRGVMPDNVWSIPAHTRGSWSNTDIEHPAVLPPELISRILRFSTNEGDIVLDPFAGSGSVVAQANILDRRGIGIELNEQFVEAYDVTKDEFKEEWSSKVDSEGTLEDQQRRLAGVIWGLRQLIYAKKLVVYLRQERNAETISELGLHSIFILSGTPNEDALKVETPTPSIIFGVDDIVSQTRQDQLLKELEEEIQEPPWTGFDIHPDLMVESVSTLRSNQDRLRFGSADSLYLYSSGRHYAFDRRMKIEEWMEWSASVQSWRAEFASEKFPPLLSNISVRVSTDGEYEELDTELLQEPTEAEDQESFSGTVNSDVRTTTLAAFSQQGSDFQG